MKKTWLCFWICVEVTSRAHSRTIFYQTSFKRSQPFWVLIGARKFLCFYAQAEHMRPASCFSVLTRPGNNLTNRCSGRLLPTSHPSEDARMARRQQNRAAQDWAVGRKILDRASKSVTSCNVDSPETKWCDSFSQSKGGKLYLAPMCSFLGCTLRPCLHGVGDPGLVG